MLQSSRLLLRALEPADLNATYLGWLNDPSVNRYLETRFLPQTLEALQAYWQAHRDDPAALGAGARAVARSGPLGIRLRGGPQARLQEDAELLGRAPSVG